MSYIPNVEHSNEVLLLHLTVDLKKTYKNCFQKHQIHAVDEINKIIVKEENIHSFAVTLKISHTLPPACTFKDETRQHLENLIGATSNDVHLSKLFDESNRVTFVCGIAGIGKSVLAKQLACGWANDDIYTNFKILVMFECRKINKFKAMEGKDLKDHEIIDEFLKRKLDFTCGYREKIMFVIDGLDELFDIHTKNSIIFELLDSTNAKYRESKFVVTGRPRVECNLYRYGESVGGIRKVEIYGLSDMQIQKFVQKSAYNEKACNRIYQAMNSSKRLLPILHVPQFLNTFCCVVQILTKSEKVQCKAELYAWTIFLLLRQHAEKQGLCNPQADEIFKVYSKELMALAEICHELLMTNTIIFEKKIASLFGSDETKKTFFQGLFVDVSDNITTKYQFKHLSLVEFLSAVHICSTNRRKKHIREMLEKDYIETVVHACELLANFACDGIIKTMLCCAANVENVDDILTYILKGLSRFSDEIKFKRSLEVLSCFLTKGAIKEKSILSSVGELGCGPLYKSVASDSNNLYDISQHLKIECRCGEDVLKGAFKSFEIGEFVVDDVKTVGCVHYMGSVDLINFNGMKLSLNAARREVGKNGGGKCSFVWIEDCEATETDEEKSGTRMSNTNLDELVIWDSRLNEENFICLVEWGTSGGKLNLDQLKVETEWWLKMVKEIERKKTTKDLAMSELVITRCEPQISKKLQERVR